MPVAALIIATTNDQFSAAEIDQLNLDMIDQMGQQFCGIDDRAVSNGVDDELLDLPDNFPSSQTIVVCHPNSPYYGPGYERGSWPTLAALIEMLGHRIPNSTVWYGEDSSGQVELATEKWLREMWNYWSANGCRPYSRKFGDNS